MQGSVLERFTLRDKLQFHDGTPLTATDVIEGLVAVGAVAAVGAAPPGAAEAEVAARPATATRWRTRASA